jgi:hypothetical protein
VASSVLSRYGMLGPAPMQSRIATQPRPADFLYDRSIGACLVRVSAVLWYATNGATPCRDRAFYHLPFPDELSVIWCRNEPIGLYVTARDGLRAGWLIMSCWCLIRTCQGGNLKSLRSAIPSRLSWGRIRGTHVIVVLGRAIRKRRRSGQPHRICDQNQADICPQ